MFSDSLCENNFSKNENIDENKWSHLTCPCLPYQEYRPCDVAKITWCWITPWQCLSKFLFAFKPLEPHLAQSLRGFAQEPQMVWKVKWHTHFPPIGRLITSTVYTGKTWCLETDSHWTQYSFIKYRREQAAMLWDLRHVRYLKKHYIRKHEACF